MKIAAGGYHGLFLGSDGNVYSCGRNDLNQLGRGGNPYLPVPILSFSLQPSEFVNDVTAGVSFSLLITSNFFPLLLRNVKQSFKKLDLGNIYSFGNNTGFLENVVGPNIVPVQVNLFNLAALSVAVGWSHAIVLTSTKFSFLSYLFLKFLKTKKKSKWVFNFFWR